MVFWQVLEIEDVHGLLQVLPDGKKIVDLSL